MDIQRDARVVASDGDAGRVTHVIVSPDTREVTDIIVRHHGADYQVPMSAVASVEGDEVRLQGDSTTVYRGRRFNREGYQPLDEERAREESQGTAIHGGAPLRDATDDTVRIGAETRTQAAAVPAVQAEGDDAYRLQLREERLRLETVSEQVGAVRLTRRVIERVETVEVPLREERVVIEVLPNGGGKVHFEGQDLNEGDVIEVVVYEERVNVEKQIVVNEDVRIRKEMVEHTERVEETLRKEELIVDDPAGLIGHQDQATDLDREEWRAARSAAGLSGEAYQATGTAGSGLTGGPR